MAQTGKKESLLPPPWVLTTAVFLLAVWVIAELREIVVLLVVGYSIAYVLDPILDFFERKRISRSRGILIILCVLVLFVIVLLMTAVPTLVEQYTLLVTNLPSYVDIARDRFGNLVNWAVGIAPAPVAARLQGLSFSDVMPEFNSDTVNRVLSGAGSTLLQGYSLTMTLFNATLLPFIVYYIAVDFTSIYRGFLGLFPGEKRTVVQDLLDEINGIVSAFVRGQALVACILFILYSLGLSVVGVRLWFILAVIAGFGNVIPYVGTVTGIVLSSIMALVTFGDFRHVVFVWIVFGAVQLVEGFLVTPFIVGSRTGFSPLVIILALFAGGSLFGLLGLVLAIPAAAVFKVLFSHGHRCLIAKLEMGHAG